MKKIIVVGYGGHAKSVIDSIESMNKFSVAGVVVKDDMEDLLCGKYEVIGSDQDLPRIFKAGITKAVIAIGYLGKYFIRDEVYSNMKLIGYEFPNIIDSTAVVSSKSEIGEGTFVGKGAIVNTNASIGKMCIINSGAIIEHECKVGNFSHVSVGSIICGQTEIGEHTFIGAGSTIIQNKNIGNNVIVGAGTTVIKNINSDSLMYNQKVNSKFRGGGVTQL